MKSAAQRVIDYFCGNPMGADVPTVVKQLAREDRQRRQMERAIVARGKLLDMPLCVDADLLALELNKSDQEILKIARRLVKEKPRE